MAFSAFKYPGVLTEFALAERSADLFVSVPPVVPSPTLLAYLTQNHALATLMNTEKARAELLVAPVLSEVWTRSERPLNFFSGAEFNADPEAGLNGYVDFLFGHGPQLPRVTPPVFLLFEAKKDDIADGYGQCIAAMVGAERYNRRLGTPADTIFGGVTTGSVWKFLQLDGGTVTFDRPEYAILPVDRLLGVLMSIVGR